jgi:AcrR family transcriptional regulator
MGRWEPGAQGRLADAAMALYAEQGFEKTTAAEIAARAGLTERTYYRHFADKREVLFHGMETARHLVESAVEGAPTLATPMDAVGAALLALGTMLQKNHGHARLTDSIVSANPELQERELAKLAGLAASTAAALRGRGVPAPAASLAAEAGIAVFKVAFARWVSEPDQPHLPGILQGTMEELGAMFTGRVEA